MNTPAPARGEVWMAVLDPIRGHEQGGTRPVLVISVDTFNQGPADLVIVLPVTSRPKGVRSHVEVLPPEGGLSLPSFIKCEDVRSIAVERLGRRLGTVIPSTMSSVEYVLRSLMGL